MMYYFSIFYFVILFVVYLCYYNNAEKMHPEKILTLTPKNVSHLSATRKSNVSHNITRNNL